MNKLPGRVGDSAIIGAGTYANNNICAVSGTGHGEIFMRLLLSYDIAAQINYKKISLEKATKNAIKNLAELNGKGGVIALDRLGNHVMLFNTDCMFRGVIDSEQIFTAIQ
jgi:beta-aspartyl-peptidase (threonine type)